MASADRSSPGARLGFVSDLIERLIPDDFTTSLPAAHIAELARAFTALPLLALVDGLLLLEETNHKVDGETLAIDFVDGQRGTDLCLFMEPLPPEIFMFTKGMEFDLKAQELFDEYVGGTAARLRQGQEPEKALAATRWIADTQAGQRVMERLAALRARLPDASLSRSAASLAARRLDALVAEHTFVEYRAEVNVAAVNLENGARLEENLTERITERRRSTGDAGAADKESARTYEVGSASGFPLLVIEQYSLIDVHFRIARTTGVRELVKKGLAAYEQQAPIATAGAARFGSAGEHGGRILDRAVLEMLEDRFLSEEEPIPDGRFRVVFHQRKVNRELLRRFGEGTVARPLERGRLCMYLNIADQRIPPIQILRITGTQ